MKLFKQVFASDVISRVASSALCMRVVSTSSILTGMLLLAWTVMWVTVRKLCNVKESGAAKPEGYLMRIDGKLALFLALLAGFILCSVPARAQDAKASDSEVQQLRELVMKLQSRIDQLERNQGTNAQPVRETPPASPQAAGSSPSAESQAIGKEDRSVLDYFRGTTVNGGVDGYYGYNFNQPIGRVNLLRAYDVMSNSFSLNQANFILEHAPDVDAGRRWGARLDFQYGQATETVQGSAANELRPQAYRPVWQAYRNLCLSRRQRAHGRFRQVGQFAGRRREITAKTRSIIPVPIGLIFCPFITWASAAGITSLPRSI